MEIERSGTPSERLAQWLAASSLSLRAFAGRCNVHPPRITEATHGRVPSAELREAIERETGRAILANEWLEAPKRTRPPPSSERRPLAELSPEERLERAIEGAREELEVALADGARASLRATIIRAERDLATLRSKGAIEAHPGYPALVKTLLDAVEEVYGSDKLVELAAALERRENVRERRAA